MVKIIKKSENIYEIPKEGEMNVPGLVFASEKIINAMNNRSTLATVSKKAQEDVLERAMTKEMYLNTFIPIYFTI